MAIYTDGIHMISSTGLDELHAFAASIGMPRRWFHPSQRHPHYDILSDEMRETVRANHAVFVSSKDIVRLSRKLNDGAQGSS